MARGRPPSPDSINYLKGDPGKRRRYEVEPQAPQGIPEAPESFCPVARAEWDSITPQLAAMGVLSLVDQSALAQYCEAWARYREAHDYIQTHGFDGPNYKAAANAVRDNASLCKAFLIEFGCTPAARARMRVQPKKEATASKWAGKLKLAK